MQSRILSALGYHQPPVYFLPSFTMRDGNGTHQERGGRFRPTLPELEELGDWSWQQNPFVGTKPYQGLLVILLMFGSADLKNSNNSLYAFKRPGRHHRASLCGAGPRQRAGRHRALRLDEERSGRLRAAAVHRRGEPGFVVFPYHGWHQELFRARITPDDAAWAGNLDGDADRRPWDAAFRAGGFDPVVAARFKADLKSAHRAESTAAGANFGQLSTTR